MMLMSCITMNSSTTQRKCTTLIAISSILTVIFYPLITLGDLEKEIVHHKENNTSFTETDLLKMTNTVIKANAFL